MLRAAVHVLWFLVLTLGTQIGGIAWIIALMFRRRWLAFLLGYTALTIATFWIAPLAGRQPLPCLGEKLRMQSWIYCALNRHYVVPELAVVLQDSAEAMEQSHAGTVTLILDAGFPFFDGFPLLPHLSHHDGRKVDLAFYYADTNGDYLPGATRSPIGYFAFEQGPSQCPESWPTLRWDLDWAQPLWTTYTPDVPRMKALLGIFAGDSRIGKILLEPHLVASWGVAHPKIRFQGCRAARHDDHVHVQM